MARVVLRASAPTLLVVACLWTAACKSVPTPTAVLVPEPVVARETKVGWVVALEHERRLRMAGAAPVAGSTAMPPGGFRQATGPALDALAHDPDPVVRQRAILALGRIGTAEAVPILSAAVADPEERVRATAAFALGLVGRDAAAALPVLQGALADPALVVRARAIDALGLLGIPSAVPFIYQAASGCPARLATLAPDDEQPMAPEIEVCRSALFAAVRLQSFDAVAGLTINGQGAPVSRWWPVAYALQRINDRRAAAALAALARGPGVYTVGFALRGLAQVKDPALVPIAKAMAIDRNADVKVRIAAVRALGQIGGADAATPLADLLIAPAVPPIVVLETIAALGATRYAPALDVVLDYARDPSPAVRAAALTAAAAVSPDGFLVVLAGLDRDRDWSVRAALAGVLATLPADRVTAALLDLAADDDARVRVPAMEAMATLKVPGLSTRLFAALEATDFVERATAARLIGTAKLDGAVPRLVAAYERGQSDTAYVARAAALVALAAYGGDEVRALLRRGLGDRDWAVRWRTAELLRGLGDTSAAPETPAPLHHPSAWYQSDTLLTPAFSPHAFIETRAGTIELELDVVDAPVSAANFIELARAGFFNGMKVHRVVPTFVVQAGDPRGDGEGGPGYTIRDELSAASYVRGTVGMALDWRDTGGSQFFIVLSPQPHLDGKYTVLGRVVAGWAVLDQLAPWDVIDRVRVWDGVEFK